LKKRGLSELLNLFTSSTERALGPKPDEKTQAKASATVLPAFKGRNRPFVKWWLDESAKGSLISDFPV